LRSVFNTYVGKATSVGLEYFGQFYKTEASPRAPINS